MRPFQYRPTYAGAPVQEMNNMFNAAASVYDVNENAYNTLELGLAQMRAAPGDEAGQRYLDTVKTKLREGIGQVAKDAQGKIRFDQARSAVRDLALKVAGDENLKHVQDNFKLFNEFEDTKRKLAASGHAPLVFGDPGIQSFNPDGSRNRFNAMVEPHGDHFGGKVDVWKLVKPDMETSGLGKAEIEGYLKYTATSDTRKKVDQYVDKATDLYIRKTEGDQEYRMLLNKYGADGARSIIREQVKAVGLMGAQTQEEAHYMADSMAQIYAKAAAKGTTAGKAGPASGLFNRMNMEIATEGKTFQLPDVGDDKFDQSGMIKPESSVKVPTGASVGIPGVPAGVTTVDPTSKTVANQLSTFRSEYPEYAKKDGKGRYLINDRDLYKQLKVAQQGIRNQFRVGYAINNPILANNLLKLAGVETQLDSKNGYVVGKDPQDTKTLKAQAGLEGVKNEDIEISDVRFNLSGRIAERGNAKGGLMVHVRNKKSSDPGVDVVIPAPDDIQSMFDTVTNLANTTKNISKVGFGKNDTKGHSKIVKDSSGIIGHVLKQSSGSAAQAYNNASFGFQAHRYFERVGNGFVEQVEYIPSIMQNGKWVPAHTIPDAKQALVEAGIMNQDDKEAGMTYGEVAAWTMNALESTDYIKNKMIKTDRQPD